MVERMLQTGRSLKNAADTDVAVLLSAGIDSSIVPELLMRRGYPRERMKAFRFNLWAPEPDEAVECRERFEMQDAKEIADHYGIEFFPLYWEKIVYDAVFGPAFDQYFLGATPNPDMSCNDRIKFGIFAEYALNRLGARSIATGHHVRRRDNPFRLLVGKDPNKDQSYFLGTTKRDVLARTLFPVGEFLKDAEVRAMAREFGIPKKIQDKRSSRDWCFVAKRQSEKDTDPAKFTLDELLRAEGARRGKVFSPGPIFDEQGQEVGTHNGVMLYAATIGQKVGFKDGFGVPGGNGRKYVVGRNISTNSLSVASAQPASSRVVVRNLNWLVEEKPSFPLRCLGKIRTPSKAAPLRAELVGDDEMHVVFDEPQTAPALGQACVLYDGEMVLGGGTIVN